MFAYLYFAFSALIAPLFVFLFKGCYLCFVFCFEGFLLVLIECHDAVMYKAFFATSPRSDCLTMFLAISLSCRRILSHIVNHIIICTHLLFQLGLPVYRCNILYGIVLTRKTILFVIKTKLSSQYTYFLLPVRHNMGVLS